MIGAAWVTVKASGTMINPLFDTRAKFSITSLISSADLTGLGTSSIASDPAGPWVARKY
jgi:hypothetical protein